MSQSSRKQPFGESEQNAQALIQQLERIAFADVRRLCRSTGEPLPLDQISAADAAAIKTVRRREWTNKDGRPGGETILELHDKVKALELLGDHVGLWERAPGEGAPRILVLMPGETQPRELPSALAVPLLEGAGAGVQYLPVPARRPEPTRDSERDLSTGDLTQRLKPSRGGCPA